MNEMKNTIIRTANGSSIDSQEGWTYAIHVNPTEFESVIYYNLLALKIGRTDGEMMITEQVDLLNIRGKLPDEACSILHNALISLLKAIANGDKFWDNEDHGSDLIEGTTVKPSTSAEVSKEDDLIEGTTVKPSTC